MSFLSCGCILKSLVVWLLLCRLWPISLYYHNILKAINFSMNLLKNSALGWYFFIYHESWFSGKSPFTYTESTVHFTLSGLDTCDLSFSFSSKTASLSTDTDVQNTVIKSQWQACCSPTQCLLFWGGTSGHLQLLSWPP